MKQEYKTLILSLLEAVAIKNKIIMDMLEGNIPADQMRAMDLAREIKTLLEKIENYIDIS